MTDIEIVIADILASKNQIAYKRWLADRREKIQKCKNDTNDDKKIEDDKKVRVQLKFNFED